MTVNEKEYKEFMGFAEEARSALVECYALRYLRRGGKDQWDLTPDGLMHRLNYMNSVLTGCLNSCLRYERKVLNYGPQKKYKSTGLAFFVEGKYEGHDRKFAEIRIFKVRGAEECTSVVMEFWEPPAIMLPRVEDIWAQYDALVSDPTLSRMSEQETVIEI